MRQHRNRTYAIRTCLLVGSWFAVLVVTPTDISELRSIGIAVTAALGMVIAYAVGAAEGRWGER